MTANNGTTPENERRFWPPNWHFLLGPPSWLLLLAGYLIAAAFAAILILLAFAARAQQPLTPKDLCCDADWTEPSLTMNICDAGMPCGEKTDKQTLRAAYQYCQTTLLVQEDRGMFISPQYADSACPGIVSRWLQSDWRKAEDEANKAIHKAEMAHAKAFVEAVARQK